MGGAGATKLDGKTTRNPRGENTKRNQPTRSTGARRSRYRQPDQNVTPGDFFEIPTTGPLGRPVLFFRHDARQSLREKKQLSETLVVGHALPGPTNHRLGTSSTPESAASRSPAAPAAAFPTTARHVHAQRPQNSTHFKPNDHPCSSILHTTNKPGGLQAHHPLRQMAIRGVRRADSRPPPGQKKRRVTSLRQTTAFFNTNTRQSNQSTRRNNERVVFGSSPHHD